MADQCVDFVAAKQTQLRALSLTQSLNEAVKLGDLEEIKRLIAQDLDVDAQAKDGHTPLVAAINQGNLADCGLIATSG